MNYLVVIDPDDDRRRGFIESWRAGIAPIHGLAVGHLHAGACSVLWAVAPETPVDSVQDEGGCAVIFGAAHEDGRPVRVTELRRERPASAAPPLDGLHVCITSDGRALRVSGDVLGILPVYFGAFSGGALVASSPELFKRHPAIHLSFDPSGLIGLLMTTHSLGGRTLFREVRRAQAGHMLRWSPETGFLEASHYQIPEHVEMFDTPLPEVVDSVDGVLDRAVRSALPATGGQTGMLLSGGLDSRMLAGYLHRQSRQVQALTLGVRDDFEVQCARAVAGACGFSHHVAEIDSRRYPDLAQLQSRWEHGLNGFVNVTAWDLQSILKGIKTPSIMTGYIMDPIVGGSHMTWAFGGPPEEQGFQRMWRQTRRWGLSDETIVRLVRPDVLGSILHDLNEEAREAYGSYAARESRRAWAFDLRHRQRFHVGRNLWVLGFSNWPSAPAMHRAVLSAAASVPAALLSGRWLQRQICVRKFRRLAELPLDRNSDNTSPLVEPHRSYAARIARKFVRPIGRTTRDLQPRLFPGRERRRYFRVCDYNSTGWQAVRELAAEGLPHASAVVDPTVARQVMGTPGARLKVNNVIADTAGAKVLVGFLLWSKDNL
jgi:asparagine synthase (glutamine-hydrolysing)